MTRNKAVTEVTAAKPDLETEIGTRFYRNLKKERRKKKPNRIVRRAAEEQWAETLPPLAAADRRPCRDFFH